MNDLIEQAAMLMRAERRFASERPAEPVHLEFGAQPVPGEDDDTPLFI